MVPEIASRTHLSNILPVVQQAIADAGLSLEQVDAVAVANRPGLIGSLLIGVTAAKTLAWSLGKPLIAVDHVHAHLYSVMLKEKPKNEGGLKQTSAADATAPPPSSFSHHPSSFPSVGLVCSGGHTALYRLNSWLDVQRTGGTIDDAVGEAYDKVAAILNLGYPGGPILDRLAAGGDPTAVKFPRTLLGRESLDFSFSGLKTAVLYHVRGVPRARGPVAPKPAPTETEIANIAASFQAAVIDTLTTKLKRAARQFDAQSVIVGGGVSANRGLRAALAHFPLPVHFPPPAFCTDNAAMIAGLADLQFQRQDFAPLDLDAITYSSIV